MPREPIRHRRTFQRHPMQGSVVWGISRRFHRLSPCVGQVAHVLRTLPPVAGRALLLPAAPRLACVKPAASVHPEPGSNSSLYILYLKFNPALLISYQKSTLSIFCVWYLLPCTFVPVFSMISAVLAGFRPAFPAPLTLRRWPL